MRIGELRFRDFPTGYILYVAPGGAIIHNKTARQSLAPCRFLWVICFYYAIMICFPGIHHTCRSSGAMHACKTHMSYRHIAAPQLCGFAAPEGRNVNSPTQRPDNRTPEGCNILPGTGKGARFAGQSDDQGETTNLRFISSFGSGLPGDTPDIASQMIQLNYPLKLT